MATMGGSPMGGDGQQQMSAQEQQQIRMIQSAMESCPVKVGMAGVAGIFIVYYCYYEGRLYLIFIR